MKVYKRTVEEIDKISSLQYILINLEKQDNLEVVLACARDISNDIWKSRGLKAISAEMAKQGKVEEATSVIEEALSCARGISSDSAKNSALKDISNELAKQGKFEEAASTMQEAFECKGGISEESSMNSTLKKISIDLAKQGKIEKALEHTNYIIDEFNNGK